jgi:hypothetical protein
MTYLKNGKPATSVAPLRPLSCIHPGLRGANLPPTPRNTLLTSRSGQVRSGQHKPLIDLAFHLVQDLQIWPHAAEEEQRLPHRPRHIATKLPALRLRQDRVRRDRFHLLAPLDFRFFGRVDPRLAVLSHIAQQVRDPLALVLRAGRAVAPPAGRLRAVGVEQVRVPGHGHAEVAGLANGGFPGRGESGAAVEARDGDGAEPAVHGVEAGREDEDVEGVQAGYGREEA